MPLRCPGCVNSTCQLRNLQSELRPIFEAYHCGERAQRLVGRLTTILKRRCQHFKDARSRGVGACARAASKSLSREFDLMPFVHSFGGLRSFRTARFSSKISHMVRCADTFFWKAVSVFSLQIRFDFPRSTRIRPLKGSDLRCPTWTPKFCWTNLYFDN